MQNIRLKTTNIAYSICFKCRQHNFLYSPEYRNNISNKYAIKSNVKSFKWECGISGTKQFNLEKAEVIYYLTYH